MAVHDLDTFRASRGPDKAGAPPVVDPDAVLSRPIALQGFKPVPRRGGQITQRLRTVQLAQLALRDALEICSNPAGEAAVKQRLGVPVSEAADHRAAYVRTAIRTLSGHSAGPAQSLERRGSMPDYALHKTGGLSGSWVLSPGNYLRFGGAAFLGGFGAGFAFFGAGTDMAPRMAASNSAAFMRNSLVVSGLEAAGCLFICRDRSPTMVAPHSGRGCIYATKSRRLG